MGISMACRFLLRAAAVVSSVHFANAAPLVPDFPPSKATTLSVLDRSRSGPAPSGIHHLARPNTKREKLSRRCTRRRILSKMASLRGGSSPDGSRSALGRAGGIADNDSGADVLGAIDRPSHKINGGGGSMRPSSVASAAALVVTQSLSVAGAAVVLSGCFGAWVASWMVGRLHGALPALANHAVAGGGGGVGSDGELLGKYRWTTLASVGFLLLHALGARSLDAFARASDASFVALLWAHSRAVDPLLGGAIGCAHVSLGFLSLLLESPTLQDALDGLGGVRLKHLGQYAGGDDPYVAPGEGRLARAPVLTSGPRGRIGASIADAMGSVSLLVSFPQHCLGLYLLGSTLVAWSSGERFGGGWKRFGKWVQWLGEGMCVGHSENGELQCGIDAVTAADDVMSQRIDTWKLSKRLVALYWVIALAKAIGAYVVL